MSILRLVPEHLVEDWQEALAEQPTYSAETLPHWAIATFTPSDRDKDDLISLYEIDEAVTAADVAAAMTFGRPQSRAHFFISCERDVLETAGFNLVKEPGQTFHDAVNERHYDVAVPTVERLGALALAFLGGVEEFVDIKPLEATLIQHARLDQIEWVKSAQQGRKDAWHRVMGFAAKGHVKVTGAEAPQAA